MSTMTVGQKLGRNGGSDFMTKPSFLKRWEEDKGRKKTQRHGFG
jgi:hypothetical protein